MLDKRKKSVIMFKTVKKGISMFLTLTCVIVRLIRRGFNDFVLYDVGVCAPTSLLIFLPLAEVLYNRY